jgi:hypothetical protein
MSDHGIKFPEGGSQNICWHRPDHRDLAERPGGHRRGPPDVSIPESPRLHCGTPPPQSPVLHCGTPHQPTPVLHCGTPYAQTRALHCGTPHSPATVPGAVPGAVPGHHQGVNLREFGTLQLPTGSRGRPDMVHGGRLDSYNNSQLFERNGRAITFKVPEGSSATTRNSSFPRSELAENRTWKMSDGRSVLSGSVSIDKLPRSGSVVFAQIHQRVGDGAKPRPPVELIYKNGSVYASVLNAHSQGAGRKETKIADHVEPGEAFAYSMKLGADGTVDIKVGKNQVSLQLHSSFHDSNFYFKAGNYPQDRRGGSEVTYYALDIEHGRPVVY